MEWHGGHAVCQNRVRVEDGEIAQRDRESEWKGLLSSTICISDFTDYPWDTPSQLNAEGPSRLSF